MNRRNLLSSVGLLGASLLLPQPLWSSPKRTLPNFVLILTDDLGFGDIEPYGGIIPTPNITKLAASGCCFENYYAPANLCTPSRAGILTGRYPIRTGLGWEVLLENDKRGLSVTEQTIADCLRSSYYSGLIGKWHLGTDSLYWPPTKHGFDEFFGIPYSHDMTPLSLFESSRMSSVVGSQPVDLSRLQGEFCDRAERFLDNNAGRPFFLELALSAPHLPNVPPTPFKHKSKAGSYGDVVMEIDAIVGRVLDKLDKLGLADETLILFTSDNGPWYEGSPGPLRDRKGGSAYDGASRVPFIARMPGVIPAGSRNRALISGLDILPTCCAMANLPLPRNTLIDGKDITSVLKGGQVSPHDEIVLFNNEDVAGIRTQRWKYVAQTYYRGGRSDYIERGFPQLYDMELEAGENYSVADLYPDVLAEMQNRWRAAVAEFAPLRTPRPAGFDWLSA